MESSGGQRDTAWAMSEENVEKVRAVFAAHNRGDLDAWMDLYGPGAVLETLLLGTHHGKEAMRSLYEENQANQSGYTVTPVELIDAGDKVITVAQVGGAGSASQIALDDQIAFIHTFKNGLVVREQTFRNREEALEAAGLSE
jgi:ketosteroid isomerase-like protein